MVEKAVIYCWTNYYTTSSLLSLPPHNHPTSQYLLHYARWSVSLHDVEKPQDDLCAGFTIESAFPLSNFSTGRSYVRLADNSRCREWGEEYITMPTQGIVDLLWNRSLTIEPPFKCMDCDQLPAISIGSFTPIRS
ncbi:hypothetical protein An07g01840 [Aspergillus niger]|uniref:Uncharacterized protein n=2 Tax=Aspergillus niger TaxID=5061 RepID=A2QME8_ASPNC|nr:hypothetical protein An07g01840 [Aspergillus niger]CAK48086.1 hypothetical protein An07g01840 [Aspergillus niger]